MQIASQFLTWLRDPSKALAQGTPSREERLRNLREIAKATVGEDAEAMKQWAQDWVKRIGVSKTDDAPIEAIEAAIAELWARRGATFMSELDPKLRELARAAVAKMKADAATDHFEKREYRERPDVKAKKREERRAIAELVRRHADELKALKSNPEAS